MRGLGEVGRRLRMLALGGRVDREVAEELRLHEELLRDGARDEGASEPDALRIARRRLGSPLRIREESRDAIAWRWLDDLGRDVRFAVAGLSRRRGFALAVVATLGLGIGANAAIFSVVSSVVLAPLPFTDPGRLVQLYGTPAIRGEAIEHLDQLREQTTSIEALAGFNVSARYLRGPAGADRVMVVTAERDLFGLLGVAPLLGRTFGPGDTSALAVVSEQFWRTRLGGNPVVVGTGITLDDTPYTISGVMPDRFQFPYSAATVLRGAVSQARTDVWIPLDPPADLVLRARGRTGAAVARLRSGAAIDGAERELAVVTARIDAGDPDPSGARGVRLVPLSEAVVSSAVRRVLFVLLGAAGLVLALACANVTNLLLVRMVLRGPEMASRAALGGGPGRLARQALTESVVLTLAGAVAGVVLAVAVDRKLLALSGAHLPRAHEIGLDWRVFLFLAVVCALTAALSALAPILLAWRIDPGAAIASRGLGSAAGRGLGRLRDALVVAEVALAFVLAAGAAILGREVVRLQRVDPGIVTTNVMTFHLGAAGALAAGESEVRRLYEIADRVSQLPGVRAAGFTQVLPLQNWGWSANATGFLPAGRPPRQTSPFTFELRYITPGYFQALGIPVRNGRGFTAADAREAPRVIVINEQLARMTFGDDDPVGHLTSRGTIVGVVGNIRNVNLDQETLPEIYFPAAQNWSLLSELGMTLVVRSDGPVAPLIDPVRTLVSELAPGHAVFNVKSMREIVAESFAEFTLFLSLMMAFAGLAVVLALTGTYGVVSYAATSRRQEFAIRVALGASLGHVTRLVIGQGLRLVIPGVVLGLAGTLALAPLLQGLPVRVDGPDAGTLALVSLGITAAALLATLGLAWRAAGAAPMPLLRAV